MENSFNDELFCSLKNELREVNAQIDVQSKKTNRTARPKKRIVGQLIREAKSQTPAIIEYRGDPKQYIAVILNAIDHGRLTYDGTSNSEQTIRSLATVIDVISPKTGKALSVETLVSYEKKEHSGEFTDYCEGDFNELK